jgi:hypothetical protein
MVKTPAVRRNPPVSTAAKVHNVLANEKQQKSKCSIRWHQNGECILEIDPFSVLNSFCRLLNDFHF